MRLTQGTFSYLPDFNDDEIAGQVRYAMSHGWALAVEFTDDPHPRNVYWELWGLPIFDTDDPAVVLAEMNRCRDAFPDHYIRLSAYDASLGRQTVALSFIVNRPPEEPDFRLERREGPGRTLAYTVTASSTDQPHGTVGTATAPGSERRHNSPQFPDELEEKGPPAR